MRDSPRCVCMGSSPDCPRCSGSGYVVDSVTYGVSDAGSGNQRANHTVLAAVLLDDESDVDIGYSRYKKAEAVNARAIEDLKHAGENSEFRYRCSKCNYPQNKDPRLKCAMCGSYGPYSGPL